MSQCLQMKIYSIVKAVGAMNFNEIINAISSCGFPIFACIYLAKSQAKQIEKLSVIISKNTDAINKLQGVLKCK